tara:strand:- start:244 stop:705 length:462 start_codon:yes stop_codon:yes gene_type:complete
MRLRAIEQRVHGIISSSVEALGYELWGVEYNPRSRGGTLRVFIDSLAGISLDDCVTVSRQVSALLDVEDPIFEEYELEVSSPGVDRRLFNKEQYSAFIGEKLHLLLRKPSKGKRKFVGVLSEVLSNEMVLQVEDGEYRIPFDILEKVRVQPNG